MAVSTIPTKKVTLWEDTSPEGKIFSGAVTLSESYRNFDFLQISFKANTDFTANIFDCKFLASAAIGIAVHQTVLAVSGTQYVSTCGFKVTSDTTLAFSNTTNNQNFVLGAKKIVGIKL